jgi:hypothetical protein
MTAWTSIATFATLAAISGTSITTAAIYVVTVRIFIATFTHAKQQMKSLARRQIPQPAARSLLRN